MAAHTHTRIHTYIHAYTRTHTYIHAHARARKRSCNPSSSSAVHKSWQAVKTMTNIYIIPPLRACCPCAPILARERHQALLHGLF